MGNCSLKGVVAEECPNAIQILTDSREIIELKSPKLVMDVVKHYPGHGIFRQGQASSPLSSHEYLIGGQLYYLLPLHDKLPLPMLRDNMRVPNGIQPPKMSSSSEALDFGEIATGAGPELEVLPRLGDGVWRVKLVINTKQLEEILSQEVNTEALIEKMRMAAASSASFTPRRSRSSWGVAWKPALSNVFKVPN